MTVTVGALGGARRLGNLVRPESHPEPRGFPVQWRVGRPGGQAGDKDPPIAPFGPALVPVLPRVDRTVRTPFHRPSVPMFACHSMRVPLPSARAEMYTYT